VALVLAVAIAAATLVAAFGAGTPASASASPARGCGGHASGSTTLTLTIGGHSRTVIVHVPKGYSGRTAVALVLNLPGSGTTAADQELFTGMDATADADGFIVAYPQALIAEGNGFDWNVPGEPLIGGRAVPAGAPDDVAFLTQLVGVLEGRYCIAPTRVYATGFSGGARMASQLACDSSGVFAAVAPVSGLRRPTPCPTTRAVPVLSFHGIADPVDPYNGHGQKYWTYSVPAGRGGLGEPGRLLVQAGQLQTRQGRHADRLLRLPRRRHRRALRHLRRGPRVAGRAGAPARADQPAGPAVGRDRRQHGDLGVLRRPPAALSRSDAPVVSIVCAR
jgi:poly(3-hydroxybutyrate) depolymerase